MPIRLRLSIATNSTSTIRYFISTNGRLTQPPLKYRLKFVPRYATFHTSIVATGKEGSAPGELYWARSVANEETHQIFVANYLNARVDIL